jgi:L-ascorbate metabolism protein UlaG (beta-lactamase superfamily)
VVERGSRRLTWLGQAGFRIDFEGTSIIIDPWVSPHEARLVPPPPLELAADGIDWLLVTHEHLDHLDLPFLPRFRERSPAARVVLPSPLVPLVAEVVPAELLVPVQPHESLDLDGLAVTVVPAIHGVTMADAYGDGSALGGVPRFVGYVLGSRGRLYHAGDTIVTRDLQAALEPLDVEYALLPINGRDAERHARGIVGNMDAEEAVALALDVGAKSLVPYHWDGFAGNTVPPGSAVEAAAGQLHVLVPARFVSFELAVAE